MKLARALRLQVAPVGVVGGAGALCRHHGRAQRMLWVAERGKGGAIVRLFDAAQNLAADADLRLERENVGNIEKLLGIVRGKLLTQAVTAVRDGA